MKQAGWRLLIKQAFDRAVGGAGLLLCAPAIGAVAGAIRATMGPPIFFRQERPGKEGRPFRLVKFRTMTDARGPDGELLSDEQRLTTVGRLLRSTSFDEVPQLWNVLRGEMSLVGPRPLLMRYLARYTPQ